MNRYIIMEFYTAPRILYPQYMEFYTVPCILHPRNMNGYMIIKLYTMFFILYPRNMDGYTIINCTLQRVQFIHISGINTEQHNCTVYSSVQKYGPKQKNRIVPCTFVLCTVYSSVQKYLYVQFYCVFFSSEIWMGKQ